MFHLDEKIFFNMSTSLSTVDTDEKATVVSEYMAICSFWALLKLPSIYENRRYVLARPHCSVFKFLQRFSSKIILFIKWCNKKPVVSIQIGKVPKANRVFRLFLLQATRFSLRNAWYYNSEKTSSILNQCLFFLKDYSETVLNKKREPQASYLKLKVHISTCNSQFITIERSLTFRKMFSFCNRFFGEIPCLI